MTVIPSQLLQVVTGGQAADDYPNMRSVNIGGLHDSLDRPVSNFVCWDSKADPSYSRCAPASEVTNGQPYGSWYLPKSYIDQHSR